MIDYRQLHHALALAEHGNFVRAADALHITQPTLTRSIQGLEADLGVRLFDRGARGVELTEVGRVALDAAQKVAIAMRDLKRNVALAKGLELGAMTIGVGPFAGSALVGPVIGQVALRYPGLSLKVIVSPWQELATRLRNRDVDLIIGEAKALENQDDLTTTWLQKRKPYLICKAGHPLAAERSVTFEQALTYPTAGPALSTDMLAAVNNSLSSAKQAALRLQAFPKIQCESWAILKDIMANSDAVSLMLPFMVADELMRRELVAVPFSDLNIPLQFGITHIRDRTSSAPALAFAQLLMAHDSELMKRERSALKGMNRVAVRSKT